MDDNPVDKNDPTGGAASGTADPAPQVQQPEDRTEEQSSYEVEDYQDGSDPNGIWPVSNFYDSKGNLVKHVEDFSNADYKQIGNGVTLHYNFTGFDESQHGLNKVNLTTAIQEAQNLNEGNSKLEPKKDNTYCNYATQDILKTVASASVNSSGLVITGMANSMTREFANSPMLNPATKDKALAAAASGGLALFWYNNTNLPPPNHGHVGTLSVGENVSKGEVANIGSNNGFLPIGPGKGTVFTHQPILDKVKYYTLSPSVSPKNAPQYIPIGKFTINQQ